MTAPWSTVMAGLVGLRLRLYDEAEACGRVDLRTDEEIAAGQWLIEHRLGRISELDGYLENIPMPHARRLWEENGAAISTSAIQRVAVPVRLPEPGALMAAPVHAHQPDLFMDERL